MSRPIVGGLVRFRRNKAAHYATLHTHHDFQATDTLAVEHIERRGQRTAVYCRKPGRPYPVAIWIVDLKALPRCMYCESEEHRSGSTRKCPVLREQAEQAPAVEAVA